MSKPAAKALKLSFDEMLNKVVSAEKCAGCAACVVGRVFSDLSATFQTIVDSLNHIILVIPLWSSPNSFQIQ